MTNAEITALLTRLFGEAAQVVSELAWQVEAGPSRLLVLLSEDGSWLRSLISIAPAKDAEPYLMQLLEANFDETQETRYALYERVLWGVFQHDRATLTTQDFERAIARLVQLQEKGLDDSFSQLAETQIKQIIAAAKQKGQSLDETLQTLERFYEEGVMGDLSQDAEQRQSVLAAWRYQLERLWNTVD